MHFPERWGCARKGLMRNKLGSAVSALMILLAAFLILAGPAFGSEYAFGSKVLASDTDVGRPLYILTTPVTAVFWDTGTAGYDDEDPVYLHMGQCDDAVINANDVRLTEIDGHPAGSKVIFSDMDMNKPVEMLPCEIVYLDGYGSEAYDLDDPVYLHHFSDCDYDHSCDHDGDHDCDHHFDSTISGYSERLPCSGEEIPVHGISYAKFTDGYKLFIIDELVNKHPEKVGEWKGLDIEKVKGLYADYYHICGTWLIKIASHTDEGIDDDVDGDDESFCCGEIDSESKLLITNDIRLTSLGGYDAGTKVGNLDADQNKLTAEPALAGLTGCSDHCHEIKYFDVNGNDLFDLMDDLYLTVPEGGSSDAVAVNNLRLSGPVI